MMKIVVLILAISSFLFAKDENKIVVAGPIATVSHPFFKMIQDDVFKDLGKKIEFKLWNNPDELRALVLKKKVDFIALPTNVAANLYNKKVDIKLINVATWGILQLVSRDKDLKTIEDMPINRLLVFREQQSESTFWIGANSVYNMLVANRHAKTYVFFFPLN